MGEKVKAAASTFQFGGNYGGFKLSF